MKANRAAALAFVFLDEGGYAEREEEGGGAVNMGVTFTVFKRWRNGKANFADLRLMMKEEATDIYVAEYLMKIGFDDLPLGLDYCVLDSAINNGVAGARVILSRSMPTIDSFCNARLRYQKTRPNYTKLIAGNAKGRTFGYVWDRRVELVRVRAHDMENSK